MKSYPAKISSYTVCVLNCHVLNCHDYACVIMGFTLISKCSKACTTVEHVHVTACSQVADYLVDPLCRGVFASSPKSLSLRSCFPLFHQYESKYGSVIMGLLRDSEGMWATWLKVIFCGYMTVPQLSCSTVLLLKIRPF